MAANQCVVSAVTGTPNALGNIVQALAGRQGEQLFSEVHGRYYTQALNRNVFFCASQAVATTTVGLATTYTGLVLSNPISSPVNLAVLMASMNQSVIQSVQPEAFGLATGFNKSTNVTHTTPATVQSSLVGSSATGYGLVDTAATLPTAPVYAAFVQNTASATVNGPGAVVDLGGAIILTPGAYIAWVTPAQASVAGMWFSFVWEEVPF